MSTGLTGLAGGTKLPTRGIRYCCSARHWATESRIIIRPGFSRRRSRFITRFAGILDQLDLSACVHAQAGWSSWQRHYVLVAGQPPIHPRIMGGALLYGLTHGIRPSRRRVHDTSGSRHRGSEVD